MVEEFQYKPWEPAVAERVQKWIDCVLAGNNPKEMAPSGAPAAPIASQPSQDDVFGPFGPTNMAGQDVKSTASFDTPVSSGDDDDLPF